MYFTYILYAEKNSVSSSRVIPSMTIAAVDSKNLRKHVTHSCNPPNIYTRISSQSSPSNQFLMYKWFIIVQSLSSSHSQTLQLCYLLHFQTLHLPCNVLLSRRRGTPPREIHRDNIFCFPLIKAASVTKSSTCFLFILSLSLSLSFDASES